MAISTIEGFKVYVNLDGTRSIIVNSDCINDCMQIYNKHHLEGVAVTIAHDYKLQNVDFVTNYPYIKNLSVSEGISDVSAIHLLPDLESLLLSGKNRKIDFSHFPVLTNFRGGWSPRFSNLGACVHLTHLYLNGYNPKIKDCTNISDVPWIKSLEINHSSIRSLNGLNKFNQLEELEISYSSNLETLCCLEESSETLQSLIFDHCKSIIHHDYPMQLDHLITLACNDCGTIPSIKFIKKMSASFKGFRFVGTDVTDGDMTPCVGLEYAAFSNKKHFSHTMEQIKKLNHPN